MDPDRGAFLQTLDLNDGLTASRLMLERFSPLFAGTIGLDNRPQVRPVEYLFEQNQALYFLTAKSSRLYAELCQTPYVQLCLTIPGTTAVFRLSGKVCFTEESEILDRCERERADVFQRLGADRKMLIACFLISASGELSSSVPLSEEKKLYLPDPDGVLIGITIKKKTELRDRLSRILERREAEPFNETTELSKLYDGALFVFAEAAKALWPRMDIQPIERAAVFETWDEREKYTGLAAKLIGNAVIEKPEDLTYWLNTETLQQLLP